MKKIIRICMDIFLIILSLIYPGFMAVMSAAGWDYNVKQGHYPEIFSVYSFWMFLGAGLILFGVVCCFAAKKPKFYIFNTISAVVGIIGTVSCMTVLHQFCIYAEQNFSGIGESMQPVSDLYRDRILPIVFPVFLMLILDFWNFLESREYRIQKKNQKLAERNAEAPKILE